MRLTLLARGQIDAFEVRAPDGSPLTREVWLRQVLSSPIEFTHFRQNYLFLPTTGLDGQIIGGGVGRPKRIRSDEPTVDGFEPVDRQLWHASIVLLDPSHHDDGQKLAIERGHAGAPLAIAKSLAAHLNKSNPPSPYVVEVGVIADGGSFWDFVERHEGNVVSATFEFYAPNMFDIGSDYERDMADLQAQENVEKASLNIQSSTGLRLKTPRIENAIEAVERGTGTARARARNSEKYNSSDSAKTATVEEPEAIKNAPLLERVKRAVSIIFGHE